MKRLKLYHKGAYQTICLVISVSAAMILWFAISSIPSVSTVFVSPIRVWNAFVKNVKNGTLIIHVRDSLIRVLGGFALGAVCSIPVAFLLGWYEGFRAIVEPWIQFLRTIPPIALIPIVIAACGIGTSAKIVIIFFAVFLTMVVTIYQGVKNVDLTLIKAARVFDANDRQLFFHVVVPASVPYIFTAVRLGLATGLTTLVAACGSKVKIVAKGPDAKDALTALEQYFKAKFLEEGKYTRIGSWWDRKGENEIDLVCENEFSGALDFYEVKLDARRYDNMAMRAKVSAFFRKHPEMTRDTYGIHCVSVADM